LCFDRYSDDIYGVRSRSNQDLKEQYPKFFISKKGVGGMSGIIFFRTKDLMKIKEFYLSIGATVWLEQENCVILKHGNFLLGFCKSETCEKNGVITFFYRTKEEVDLAYRGLREIALAEPKENEKYHIYHFFANDPENRTIEFQCFLHPLQPYHDGEELLKNRRSIRYFGNREVPDEVLWRIFEVCRFSPTAKNSQSYYFVVIRDKKTLELLASLRGNSSAPLSRAPIAVAICSDPELSMSHVQDGCIAAYHFILTSWLHGLGTCWIADMDRIQVKEALGIPKEHYVATVTPVGYPAKIPEASLRRMTKEMIRFVD